MSIDLMFEFFSWAAVLVLAIAYWLQVVKIHKHKEVRDLSLVSYSILSVGYFLLFIESIYHFEVVSIAKSLSVLFPCVFIVMLICHNKHCEWVDVNELKCRHCGKALQPYHLFCSSCGSSLGERDSRKNSR